MIRSLKDQAVSTAREDLLVAGLAVFDRVGFEAATVAAIRARARASNGSFFHVFGSKKELAGALFLEVLRHCITPQCWPRSIRCPQCSGRASIG